MPVQTLEPRLTTCQIHLKPDHMDLEPFVRAAREIENVGGWVLYTMVDMRSFV